jgi:hypothetical protein
MRTLMWAVLGLVSLFWTGLVALGHALLGGLSGLLASNEARSLGEAASQWQPPAWLAPWMDEASLGLLQSMLQTLLDASAQGLPWLGTALGWLIPLLWVIWAMVMLVLLAAGAGLHRLLPPKRQAVLA